MGKKMLLQLAVGALAMTLSLTSCEKGTYRYGTTIEKAPINLEAHYKRNNENGQWENISGTYTSSGYDIHTNKADHTIKLEFSLWVNHCKADIY